MIHFQRGSKWVTSVIQSENMFCYLLGAINAKGIGILLLCVKVNKDAQNVGENIDMKNVEKM